MAAAISNQRAAMRQQVLEAYQTYLVSAQGQIGSWIERFLEEIEGAAHSNAAPAVFGALVNAKKLTSLVVYDAKGVVAYPNRSVAIAKESVQQEEAWLKARALERERKFSAASSNYAALAQSAASRDLAAQALQAQIRCLYQAGDTSAALDILTNIFLGAEYARGRDQQGRLLALDAQLLTLEIISGWARSDTSRGTAQRGRFALASSLLEAGGSVVAEAFLERGGTGEFKQRGSALEATLNDYDNPALSSAQRRFLMKALQRLAPGEHRFPTLEAEELAAQFVERQMPLLETGVVHPAQAPGLWQLVTPNKRAVALLTTEHLSSMLEANMDHHPADIHLRISPFTQRSTNSLMAAGASPYLPGWLVSVQPRDEQELAVLTSRSITGYFWAAALLIGGMLALSIMAGHFIHRRLALARMKNDLAATVSHELKTPLAAIRILTDTLLESGGADPQQTREYLELISGENQRLQTLIDKFLTFSRLEQQKYTFEFQEAYPHEMVQSTLGRVHAAGLQTAIEEDLPRVRVDREAFSSALGNLIENAYKYSNQPKRVLLRIGRSHDSVLFQVQDNGIGLSAGEVRNIFKPFFQVDQRLSRNGSGCGLGLSIVEMIVHAHHGKVHVQSQPGSGSTFTIELPAVPQESQRRAA